MKVYLIVGVIVLAIIAGAGWFWFKGKNADLMQLAQVSPTPVAAAVTREEPSPAPDAISLTVTAPETVTTGKVTITGKTFPNADVSVNEASTIADAKGNFSLTVTLDEGDNYLQVLAVDADGQSAQKQIMVTSQTYE